MLKNTNIITSTHINKTTVSIKSKLSKIKKTNSNTVSMPKRFLISQTKKIYTNINPTTMSTKLRLSERYLLKKTLEMWP